MEDKKQQLESILNKYNKGMMTEEDKESAIYRLFEEEAAQIWGKLEREYREHYPVADPQITQSHLWNDCCLWRVDFKCVDDGGLLSDSNPVGKTFQITRDDGVKAMLRVNAKYSRTQEEVIDIFGQKHSGCGQDVYIATGQLEDYYFSNHEPPRPNIEIFVGDDGITHLYVYAFFEKGKSMYSLDFPRWQPFLQMVNTLRQAQREEINRLISQLQE